MVENETGLKINKLGTNNGDEHEENIFKKFCYEYEIKIERISQVRLNKMV